MTGQMSEVLVLYGNQGRTEAELNWIECMDYNHESKKFGKKGEEKKEIRSKIIKLKKNLEVALTKEQFSTFEKECENIRERVREGTEQEIEKRHRPTQIVFNEEALIILTKVIIPEDIKIGLSFGHKFLFPYTCDNKNLYEILAQLDLTISDAINESAQLMISRQIMLILKKRSLFMNDNDKKWLKFVHNRTNEFLKNNVGIFATKSDKGGHTVVLDVSEYEEKLLNVKDYEEMDTAPLKSLIEKEEIFINRFKKDKSLKDLFFGLPLFEPNVLGIAKFYGLVKIHKNGYPLRPITATTGSVGFVLSKIFNRMLNTVFPRTEYHIKDSYNFVKFLSKIQIKTNERLVSFDVVSMYTSIPVELVKEIILGKSNEFFELYSLNRADLESMMNFLLIECTFFTAINKTFRQLNGLPMGSCISPTLARITMDKVVDKLLLEMPEIAFIKVFVDDTIAAMKPECFERSLEVLNGFRMGQIKFTKETEREDGSIDFLNLTLKRNKNKIITNWYKKNYASGRLLNYFSSHKRTIILATAIHFIKTVLTLSDPSFYRENFKKIFEILRKNSFPETLIIQLVHTHYTFMKPAYGVGKPHFFYPGRSKELILQNSVTNKKSFKNDQEKTKYVMFPHSICNGKEIKKILYSNKEPGIVLTDSVRNTKLNMVKTIKTKTPAVNRNNLIVSSVCQCKKKIKIISTKFNETGGMAMNRIITEKKECDSFSHAYTKAKLKRGLFYANQTKMLVKYLQWKHRNKLDGPYEFPNYYLAKLV